VRPEPHSVAPLKTSVAPKGEEMGRGFVLVVRGSYKKTEEDRRQMFWQRLLVTSSIFVAESDISSFIFFYLLQIVN
jgi:hypothetical protein